MSKAITPNNREILAAQSTVTGRPEYLTSTAGALNVNASIAAGSGLATSDNQTNGTQLTRITDGTNIVNVLKSDGTAVGQNAELVAGTYLSVPFTTTTVQAVGTTDAGNYRWVSVQILTQGTSSVTTFQGSNDNVNWQSVTLLSTNNVGSSVPINNTGSAGFMAAGPLNYRYFRVNVTGISAGTTSGTIFFSTLPTANSTNSTSVSQSGTWTVGANSATGSAVPANAFYQAVQNSAGNLQGVSAISLGIDGNDGNGTMSTGSRLYNGSTFDRMRNNTNGVVVAAGTTTTQTNIVLITYNATKLVVLVNITAGAGTVTVAIDGVTSAGNNYRYNILTSTALTGVTTTPLRIFPGSVPSPNAVANDVIPRNIQITSTVVGSITYGIDYVLGV